MTVLAKGSDDSAEEVEDPNAGAQEEKWEIHDGLFGMDSLLGLRV